MTISRHLALAILILGAVAATATIPASTAVAQMTSADQAAVDALKAIGQPIYEARCSQCHSRTGGGLVGPSFHGNDRIANDAHVIRQITRGGEDMPPFGNKLTPEEILAFGTYVRNSWGNTYGVLVADEAPQ